MARGRCGPGDEIRFGNTVWYVRPAAAGADGRTTIAGIRRPDT